MASESAATQAIKVSVEAPRDIGDYRAAFWTIYGKRFLWTTGFSVAIAASSWLLHWPYALAYTVLIAVLLGAYVFTIYSAAGKTMRAHERAGTALFEFKPSGIDVSTDVSQSQCAWNAFARALENKSGFLLVFPNSVFYLVPKRSMDTQTQAALRTLIHQALGPRAKLA